jgi:hypothetical protein
VTVRGAGGFTTVVVMTSHSKNCPNYIIEELFVQVNIKAGGDKATAAEVEKKVLQHFRNVHKSHIQRDSTH